MPILATLFTGAWLGVIAIVVVVFAAAMVGNAVLLALLYRKMKRRRLCSASLEQRRLQLLEELNELKQASATNAAEEEDAEEEEEDTEGVFEDEESEFEDGEEATADESTEAVDDGPRRHARILAVRDMSELMRERFGFTDEAYDDKKYFVRYTYGFEAKLRRSSDAVKARYRAFVEEAYLYRKLNLRGSFRSRRLQFGNKTVATVLFRGKTLCVAFALDPQMFEGTKYRGEDMREVKRFARTPMLMRLTSDRRLGYAKYLLSYVASERGMELADTPIKPSFDMRNLSRNKLFAADLLKIAVLGEAYDEDYVPEEDIEEPIDPTDAVFGEDEATGDEAAARTRASVLAVRDMSASMRAKFGLTGSVYDDKKYYVRYSYGFEAKLRLASLAVKERYAAFIDTAGRYRKLNLRTGFRGQRLQYGMGTVATLLFRGKTLCVAFALDPVQYADTKYRGEDMHEVKRFARTPMLMRLTSDRRLRYAQHLLARIADQKAMTVLEEPFVREHRLESMTRDELFDAGLLKIALAGQAPDDAT